MLNQKFNNLLMTTPVDKNYYIYNMHMFNCVYLVKSSFTILRTYMHLPMHSCTYSICRYTCIPCPQGLNGIYQARSQVFKWGGTKSVKSGPLALRMRVIILISMANINLWGTIPVRLV